MKNKIVRIGAAAEQMGVSVQSVRKYCNAGKIEYSLTPYGQRVFKQTDIDKFLGKTATIQENNNTAFYIRTSDGNSNSLKTQENELTQAYGKPTHIYKDKASGLNENRKGLKALIKAIENGNITHVKATYPDRLTRFGRSYIEHIIEQAGGDVEYLHEKEGGSPHDELMQDFMSLIASFSGRLYRMRSTENQKRLLADADRELTDRESK